jgi:REP element-mobilizing transposase RayT
MSRVVLDPVFRFMYSAAMRVLAYHITWGTYGTRLHGDRRGTVDREHNELNTPVLGYDEHRWEQSRENLKYPPIRMTREQMLFIQEMIPKLCERGYWKHLADAAGPDHVHAVLTSEHNPETIRRLLKRWLTQELMKRWALVGEDRTYWAECGSIRWIGDDDYLTNAVKYVADQRCL